MNKEVGILEATGEPTNASAARSTTPTLVVRRPDDGSRPEIPAMTLRSHSRGGRSSACARNPLARQEVILQEMKAWGSIPLDRKSPDRNRKCTPTTLIALPILPRWVRVSILHRQKITLPTHNREVLTGTPEPPRVPTDTPQTEVFNSLTREREQ